MFANLKTKSHAVPTSRIEQAENKRRIGRLKRLDTKRREVESQETDTRIIDIKAVEELAAPATPAIAIKLRLTCLSLT